MAAALSAVLDRPESARAALQYGTAQGLAPLRAQLLEQLARALKDPSLAGRLVGVEGVGKVGRRLAEHLLEAVAVLRPAEKLFMHSGPD